MTFPHQLPTLFAVNRWSFPAYTMVILSKAPMTTDFGADSDDNDGNGDMNTADAGPTPSSMIVQFATLEGEKKGPQIDVPLGSTVPQMEELMNQLLENEEKVKNRLPKDWIRHLQWFHPAI